MDSQNFTQANASMMIFRVCFTVFILLLNCTVWFLTEGSAQETATTVKKVQAPDHEGSEASRLKLLESRLKSLALRLQAIEGQALIEEEDDRIPSEEIIPADTGDEPALKDLERHVEALEKRLAAVEEESSSDKEIPPSETPARDHDGFYLYTDEDWINEDAFVSVKAADAFTGAVNWILNPAFALILDYTYTDLSDPIRVRVNPDGTVDYIDEEHVLTLRSQLVF